MGLARGFGATKGVGTTDVLTSSNLFYPTRGFTFFAEWNRNGTGGGSFGTVFDQHIGANDTRLFWDNNNSSIALQVVFSTTTGSWRWSQSATNSWQSTFGSIDCTSTSNKPTIVANTSLAAVTTTTAPVGTMSTTGTGAWIIGNRPTADRNWDGSIGRIAIWGNVLLPSQVGIALNKGADVFSFAPRHLLFYWDPTFGDVDQVQGKSIVRTGTKTIVAPGTPKRRSAVFNGALAKVPSVTAVAIAGDASSAVATTSGLSAVAVSSGDASSATSTSGSAATVAIVAGSASSATSSTGAAFDNANVAGDASTSASTSGAVVDGSVAPQSIAIAGVASSNTTTSGSVAAVAIVAGDDANNGVSGDASTGLAATGGILLVGAVGGSASTNLLATGVVFDRSSNAFLGGDASTATSASVQVVDVAIHVDATLQLVDTRLFRLELDDSAAFSLLLSDQPLFRLALSSNLMSYTIGDRVRILSTPSAFISSVTGNATDRSTLIVTIDDPSGQEDANTFNSPSSLSSSPTSLPTGPSDGSISRTSAGLYEVQFDALIAGTYKVKVRGTGAATAACERKIYVSPSGVTTP